MKEYILQLVGSTIRDLRKERGLSQEELGEKADFHFSYIGKMERGEINITLINLERISKALNVGMDQFFPFSFSYENITEKEEFIIEVVKLLRGQDVSEVRKARNIITELLH